MLLSSCTLAPPTQVDNVCKIFSQYPQWYWASQRVAKRYRVPIAVQMAIIHQESRFRAKALPPRQKLLWVIPWTRPSSAYGYTQALSSTWEQFKQDTGRRAGRDSFSDSLHFLGWYIDRANKRVAIARNDTFNLYLAYHEGLGGYARQSYKNKAWLRAVAMKVNRRALRYEAQLRSCQRRLPREPWYRRWWHG